MSLSIQRTKQPATGLSPKINAANAAQNLRQAPKETAAPRTDRLELSLSKTAQSDALLSQTQRNAQMRSEMGQNIEASKQEAEARAEEAKQILLCLKIAMRILAGDIVPPEDEKYLMEHNPKLYTLAINARIEKEHPEKHPSLLEEDDQPDKLESFLACGPKGNSPSIPALNPEILEEKQL